MKRSLSYLVATGFLATMVSACANPPQAVMSRLQQPQAESNAALAKAQRVDPTLGDVLKHAAGYAVFPAVSASAGDQAAAKGTLYQYGDPVGWVQLNQAPGTGQGPDVFTEILVFENEEAIYNFKNGKLILSNEIMAMPLTNGSAAQAKYQNGILVFTTDDKAPIEGATVGGQTFEFQMINHINAAKPAAPVQQNQ
jgi:hypothetical protein